MDSFYRLKIGRLLLFSLMISSCGGGSNSGGLNNKNVNSLPEVDAGLEQTVNESSEVILSGTASDVDGSIVSFSWTQNMGTSVNLSDVTLSNPSFVTPDLLSDETLQFTLTVTDNDGGTSSDIVTINVLRLNELPTVEAGPNLTVNENTEV
ncbi:PKD domain-containing protein, partial [Paraglaciecola marina]|uniref:PKD domain-containing protein n=1 Tax=Paraglaciecola marina TaxID=2500157 RepID=UPI001EF05295